MLKNELDRDRESSYGAATPASSRRDYLLSELSAGRVGSSVAAEGSVRGASRGAGVGVGTPTGFAGVGSSRRRVSDQLLGSSLGGASVSRGFT